MGYSYDNGRDRGPPEDAPSRGGFGDRGGEGGSRLLFVRFELLQTFLLFQESLSQLGPVPSC